MQYVLGARPRQKAELAPNISGHADPLVLEQALSRQGAAFETLTPEQLEALVAALVEEYTAANLPGAGVRMQYLLARIRRNLVGLLGFIQRDIRQSGFKPVAFELRIDDRPDPDNPEAPFVPPVELTDSRGHTTPRGGHGRPCRRDGAGRPHLSARCRPTRPAARSSNCRKSGMASTARCCSTSSRSNATAVRCSRTRPPPGSNISGRTRPPKRRTARTGDAAAEPPSYPLEGLLLDDESIYRAMDTRGTGAFVPLTFNKKTGAVAAASRGRLGRADKLARICGHLDGLLAEMAGQPLQRAHRSRAFRARRAQPLRLLRLPRRLPPCRRRRRARPGRRGRPV